jgi:adenylate cyclase
MEETPAAVTTPETPRERRLAAVVFTDVVGYSAMMNADEGTTITRVGADLDRMQAQCVASGGECLNTMGDGLMLAFPSTVQAMTFATQMQEEFARRNEVEGAVPLLQHRIGIHLGDVVRMPDGALAGDGVNIAARLESSAPPGGICISQTVYDTVRGKLAFDATFAGPKTFKNIAQPIPVWHLHPRGLVPAAPLAAPPRGPASLGRRALIGGVAGAAVVAGAGTYFLRRGASEAAPASQDAKSIAVLPFLNMSEDKDASYFADGIHEDLLTQLAMLGQLKVVSRTSVMEYRNTAKKIPQIGSELKVASLVEGSVRRAGNMVRVTAQLVDAKSDTHLWAANYDRDLKDIFKVQSELATEIAKSLKVSLTATEQKQLSTAPTGNVQAYELYLRHQELMREVAGTYRSITSVNERIELLQRAVKLDPTFALAWAKLASEHARARGSEQADGPKSQNAAKEAIARAKQLAPDDLQVSIEEAAVQLHGLDDQPGAIRTYQGVLAKARYNVEALYGLAEVLNELSRDKEAAELLERGLSVDARHGPTLTRLAGTMGRYRHYDRTLDLRQKLIDMRADAVDLRAAYGYWSYWKTGSWDVYDAWRSTASRSGEMLSARVRNVDAERAIARRDFAEVHRLVEVDSADWRRPQDHGETEAGLLVLHALAWNAQGEVSRAAATARRALPLVEKATRDVPDDSDTWDNLAQVLAMLGRKDAALAAMEKAVRARAPSGNQYSTELQRRRLAYVHALLGNSAEAIAMLRRQARCPGFHIHEARVTLPLASVWNHPDFLALVADPATTAPLPLDTPFRSS